MGLRTPIVCSLRPPRGPRGARTRRNSRAGRRRAFRAVAVRLLPARTWARGRPGCRWKNRIRFRFQSPFCGRCRTRRARGYPTFRPPIFSCFGCTCVAPFFRLGLVLIVLAARHAEVKCVYAVPLATPRRHLGTFKFGFERAWTQQDSLGELPC